MFFLNFVSFDIIFPMFYLENSLDNNVEKFPSRNQKPILFIIDYSSVTEAPIFINDILKNNKRF